MTAPTTKTPYNELLDTPEPEGGQAQTEHKPLKSAVKGGSTGAVYASNENEADEVAGQSAEDEAPVLRTIADLNKYHRAKYGYDSCTSNGPGTGMGAPGRDRRLRTLRDLNFFNRSRWDARRRP